MPAFKIEHLSQLQLEEAWPVLCLGGVELLDDWWLREARELIERGGGVLVARAPDGTIHGVATYECVRRAGVGPVLAVERLVSFELSRKAPARNALHEALALIARAFSCSEIDLPLPSISRGRFPPGRIFSACSDDRAAHGSPWK